MTAAARQAISLLHRRVDLVTVVARLEFEAGEAFIFAGPIAGLLKF